MKIQETDAARADLYSSFARRHGISLPASAETALFVLQSQKAGTDISDAEFQAFHTGLRELEKCLQPLSPDDIELRFDQHRDAKHRWKCLSLALCAFYLLSFAAVTAYLIGLQHRFQTGLALVSPLQTQILNAEQANLKIQLLASASGSRSQNSTEAQELLSQQDALGKSLEEIRHLTQELQDWNRMQTWAFLEYLSAETIKMPGRNTAAKSDYSFLDVINVELRSLHAEARRQLDLIQNFLLPCAAGAIGAFVAVLRVLLGEWKRFGIPISINFMRDSLTIGLGTFAGLTIGWFLADSGTGAFSPAALSFLAGYSIDAFFDLLDRSLKPLRSSP